MAKCKKFIIVLFTLISIIISYLIIRSIFYKPDIHIPENVLGKHIEIEGMKIRYFQIGHGKDIIFLHGGMGSIEDFEPLYDKLKSQYRITSFDRPGYGYSEIKNSSYTLKTNSDIIVELIKKLNLSNPVIFGHSYGGGVALNLAQMNQANIKGYILLAPAGFYYERFEKEGNSIPMKLLRLPGINVGIALTIGPIIGNKIIEDTLTRMMGNKEKFPNNFISFRQSLWNKPISTITRAKQLEAFNNDIKSISNNYGKINSPVLILYGENDSDEIKDCANKLNKIIKKSNIEEFRNSGHYLQFDATDRVVSAINEFMKKL